MLLVVVWLKCLPLLGNKNKCPLLSLEDLFSLTIYPLDMQKLGLNLLNSAVSSFDMRSKSNNYKSFC